MTLTATNPFVRFGPRFVQQPDGDEIGMILLSPTRPDATKAWLGSGEARALADELEDASQRFLSGGYPLTVSGGDDVVAADQLGRVRILYGATKKRAEVTLEFDERGGFPIDLYDVSEIVAGLRGAAEAADQAWAKRSKKAAAKEPSQGRSEQKRNGAQAKRPGRKTGPDTRPVKFGGEIFGISELRDLGRRLLTERMDAVLASSPALARALGDEGTRQVRNTWGLWHWMGGTCAKIADISLTLDQLEGQRDLILAILSHEDRAALEEVYTLAPGMVTRARVGDEDLRELGRWVGHAVGIVSSAAQGRLNDEAAHHPASVRETLENLVTTFQAEAEAYAGGPDERGRFLPGSLVWPRLGVTPPHFAGEPDETDRRRQHFGADGHPKVRWDDKESAMAAAVRVSAQASVDAGKVTIFDAYDCTVCGGFHIGHGRDRLGGPTEQDSELVA